MLTSSGEPFDAIRCRDLGIVSYLVKPVSIQVLVEKVGAWLALAPWGVLPWAIGLLALAAWFTVLQRILHVRRELRAGGR